MSDKNEKTPKEMQIERLTEGGGAFYFLSEEEIKEFERSFEKKYGGDISENDK